MKINLWTKFGALNSKPVFQAFAQGATRLGYNCLENSYKGDIDVIWSVLWRGRMQGNQQIWNAAKQKNKPVIVLEIGGLQRGVTWKIGLNGITRNSYSFDNIDNQRLQKLNIHALPWKKQTGSILVTGQHRASQQWDSPLHMDMWVNSTIKSIRKYTDRQIIIRPHPRCPININNNQGVENIQFQIPQRIKNSYDDYDMNFTGISTVVNYSSNPGTLAAIAGVPIFVDKKSLAWPVSNQSFETIEQPITPDRSQWLNEISYTEWTIDEISTGYPLSRLTSLF